MTKQALFEQILLKKSYLCVGLDSDITKLPKHLLRYSDPMYVFNKEIIEATQDLCVAYKPNLAFYEAEGIKGWKSLEKTMKIIPSEQFTIADAKRGDIGNTSKLYAKAFFETLNFDAVTVAPYMGEDSIKPFLEFRDKWVIVLALTSNKGSQDFQITNQDNTQVPLYEKVMRKTQEWSSDENLMYVVGATHPQKFEEIRKIAPNHFLLVPGVGEQGGDLEALSNYGMTKNCGLLVNSSRGIIFASNGKDFAQKAREAAQKVQQEMKILLENLVPKL